MFNVEKFEATYKAIAEVHAKQGNGPSDGIVCCHATLKYLADEMKDIKGAQQFLAEFYKSCFEAKSLSGFASNASAAAKACKLTTGVKSQTFAGF